MRNPLSRGYQDGLAGRNSAHDHPEYREGWVMGWRERMIAWNETCKPIFGVQHSHPNKGNDSATQ